MTRYSFLLFALLGGVTLSSQAQTCSPLLGLMKLTPDLNCQVASEVAGVAFLGAPGTCFSVVVKGLLPGSGYSGLTLESSISPVTGSVAQSPAIFNEHAVPPITDEFNLVETRRVFTARSAISLPGGKVYTADMGVIGLGASTEQLIITGGEGRYQHASGVIYAFNNVIGQWGPFQGKLCTAQ